MDFNRAVPTNGHQPRRPATRRDFEIAIICALVHEADAAETLFDHYWDDDGPPYDKAPGDPNAYSTGAIGRHNVVFAHMPGLGKANAAAVAAQCRTSFPNIRLAVVVGVCGVVPFSRDGHEVVLGDVVISDGAVYCKDFAAERRQNKLTRYSAVIQQEPGLAAQYPGAQYDKLFNTAYRHVVDGKFCDECGCDKPLIHRSRLDEDSPPPVVHFDLIASGDTVLKSGEDRDSVAQQEGVIAFEMESAGIWDIVPCVVVKGACDKTM
ncbi:kinesin light chain [Apiospora marii]|uniref:kinesin light chain n=1 Tax=Apiospora marii TaxID=335849 RepID=UPI00313235CE